MAYTPDYGSQHGVDMHPVNGGGHRFGGCLLYSLPACVYC